MARRLLVEKMLTKTNPWNTPTLRRRIHFKESFI
jgi:hypothetical protein